MGYIERYFVPTSRGVLYTTMSQFRALFGATAYDCDCGTALKLLQVERDNKLQSKATMENTWYCGSLGCIPLASQLTLR